MPVCRQTATPVRAPRAEEVALPSGPRLGKGLPMKKRSLGAEGREREHSSGPKERPNGATTAGEEAVAESGGPPEAVRAGTGLPESQRGRWRRGFWPAAFLALNAAGIALVIWRVEASTRPSAELYIVRTTPETKATPEGLAHAVAPEATTEVGRLRRPHLLARLQPKQHRPRVPRPHLGRKGAHGVEERPGRATSRPHRRLAARARHGASWAQGPSSGGEVRPVARPGDA